MSEIYEIFKLDPLSSLSSLDYRVEIIFNVFGIITIIPISIVFLAIQKRLNSLYSLFYFASLLEVGIIISRLYFFSVDNFIYYDYMSAHSHVDLSNGN